MKQYAALDDIVYFWFASNDTSGSGGDGATPAADVRLAGAAADAAPVYSPIPTLLTHANYPAGAHEIAIAATAANGFAANNTYAVFCTLLVDSQNPTGLVGSFDLKPVESNLTQIGDVAQSATDLKDFADTGYDPSVHRTQAQIKATDDIDLSATQKTSVNAEVDTALADIKLDHLINVAVDTDLATTVHDNSVLGYLMATSVMSGYARATDALQAIRDQGDSAWITAIGFSTHNAAAIWSAGGRALSTPADYKADVSLLALEATLTAMKGATYAEATDSLEAIRNRGDAAWTTGGGGSISDILNVQPLIPNAIDLANTVTIRISLGLTNMVDDLPSTVEITPGTITIDRKAIGGTTWTNIVNAAACSELAGLIYYDEVFNTATGYVAGDTIRIIFKSQKITVAANDYEITGTDGWIFHTYIREAMRGTDGANTTTPPTVGETRTEMEGAGTKLATIEGYTDKIDDGTDGLTAIKAEVEGLGGAAMRGTDSANTTVPDAAGVAPTAAEIKTEIEQVGSSIAQILADTGTDGVVIAAASKTGYALSAAGVDAILDEIIEGTITLRQGQRILLSMLASKSSGGGTATLIYRDSSDTKNRLTFTVDADGNRSAVTRDVV